MSVPTLETQTADATARVQLPEQFANATVTLRAVSDDEVVIRLANAEVELEDVEPEDVPPLKPLSNEDRDFLLNLIENPPEPGESLKKLAKQYKERYG